MLKKPSTISILLIIAAVSLICIKLLLVSKFFEDDRTRNQELESKIAYSIPLGIPKEEFIKKAGNPDNILLSVDGRYQ